MTVREEPQRNANGAYLCATRSIVLMALAILPGWCMCSGSCLPPKLAKRVKSAGPEYGRLMAYATIARRQSRTLAWCLPSYRPWPESPWSPGVCDFQTPFDIVECAWTEMHREIARWRPGGSDAKAQAANLRSEVAKAHDSFERAVKSHPTFLQQRIDRIRWLIEDINVDLGRMTQNSSLRTGAGP
jgi:hypothetical protein